MTKDEQEALSIKYNVARIVRLTSGNYALFAPWSNADGMPLITIGPIEDLLEFIPSSTEVAEWCRDNTTYTHFDEDTKVKAKSLLETLGLGRPKQKVERRI
jgi:hypothetical protein